MQNKQHNAGIVGESGAVRNPREDNGVERAEQSTSGTAATGMERIRGSIYKTWPTTTGTTFFTLQNANPHINAAEIPRAIFSKCCLVCVCARMWLIVNAPLCTCEWFCFWWCWCMYKFTWIRMCWGGCECVWMRMCEVVIVSMCSWAVAYLRSVFYYFLVSIRAPIPLLWPTLWNYYQLGEAITSLILCGAPLYSCILLSFLSERSFLPLSSLCFLDNIFSLISHIYFYKTLRLWNSKREQNKFMWVFRSEHAIPNLWVYEKKGNNGKLQYVLRKRYVIV